ncbi:MAG: branched-chain amino acid ABC transporter substrate-binding protein [Candidatus Dormibacteraeota bacterium]|nr:branched-chain amino acid ABC transporter substrate-binding protein [Candidatus Dormibacteraeota bacterium]
MKVMALPIAGVLALAACGGAAGSGGSTIKGTITIASDYPASGGEASTGIPEQQGVAFAVSQHSNIKGFKIVYKPYDDAVNGVHDPQKGAQNAADMAGNTQILGMVGPNNSNVAKAIIPILAPVPLAMISPANTNECLTKPFPYCNPAPSELRKGSTNNYFRIAGTDDQQGPAMADYAYNSLKFTKVAVFSDNETFGVGVANNFVKRWTQLGGTVVNNGGQQQGFDAKNTSNFDPFINAAKNGGAQAIYIGATTGNKPCVFRAQMKGILDVPLLGPDGFALDPQCIKDAGANAAGIYGTTAGSDPTQSKDQAVKDSLAAYKKVYPKSTDIATYTFQSYDSALVMLDAVGRAIDANGGKLPSRAQVRDAVAKTKNFKGMTGTWTFDGNGDITTPVFSYYQSDPGNKSDGEWKFLSSAQIKSVNTTG